MYELDLFENRIYKTGMSVPAQPKELETGIRPLCKSKKGSGTLFPQQTGPFIVIRNDAKIAQDLFAGIIGKVSALSVLQYINFIDTNPSAELSIH